MLILKHYLELGFFPYYFAYQNKAVDSSRDFTGYAQAH